MKKTYKKIEEKLTSEGTELRQPVAELEVLETDHKQAEQPLGKTQGDKLAILNSISELVIYQDTEHRVLWTNKAAAESVGMTHEQLVGRYCYEIWPQRNQPCEGCPVARARQTGKPQKAEITTPDGRTWSIRGYPILDEYDRVTGIIELVLNVTERKKAEQALADEAIRRRILIDQSLDGIVVLDENAKVYEANQKFAEMLGYTPEEIRELHTWDWDIQWSREELLEMGRKVDETGYHLETYHSRKDGTTIDVEISVNGAVCAGQKLIFCVCHDVTERKQMEEALKESEERFRIASQIASDVVYERDLQTGIATFYGDIDSHFGYEPGEYPRTMEGWREHVHPEDLAWIDSQSIYQMEPGVPHSIEYRMRKKDGTYMTWLDKVTMICDEKTGKPLKFLGAATDITERKQAEEKLQTILKTALDGFWLTNLEGKLLEVNDSCCKMIGYTREELLNMSISDLEAIENHEDVAQHIKRIIEQGYGRFESQHKRKDGKIIDAEISVNYLDVGEGQLFVFARDITERKKAEQALRDSEEKTRKMFESVTDGISVVDLNGIITEVNQRTVEMHGLGSKDELVGRNAFDFVAPRDREKIARNMHRAVKEGTISDIEYTLLKSDGSEFPAELSTSALKDASGKVIGHITISRDITERKRAEQALRQSEEKYKELAESITDVFFAFDKNLRYTYWNKASEQLTGISAKDALGKNLYDIFPDSEMTKRAERGYLKALKTQQVQSFVNEYHIGGRDYSFEISAYPSKNGLSVFARDITERKRAEQAIQVEKNKLQSLIDALEDDLSIQDKHYNIIYQNKPSKANLGNHLGEKCYRAYEGGDKVCDGCPVEKAFKDGKSHTSERRIVTLSGEVTYLENTANPIRDASGEMVACLEVGRNITERKQAEEALKESEDFSSSLLANSPNPMLVINQDTSVRYINPALEKLTGFSPRDVIGGKAPYPWWTEETLKKTAKDLDQAMLQGARRLEELFQKKNGERFWVEITSTPITSNGKFKYYLANWVDITERKQAAEREKEMQKELLLSSRLASIGELAAGVAHQINNPLTGVLGFSQRLLKKSTDQETSQDLKRIYTEAERAAKVVQNLLTFARRRQPHKQYSDINEILESALELRAYELKTSNIEVITRLAPSLPEIMLDFYQIQEVFLNIILNAEQALTEAHSGGKLIIKTKERKGHIRTTFTDDGPGIPAERLDKIFDPFYTTKGEKGGTGLGLSVCHGIITEHGGKIYARSKPSKGTAFFVELPLAHN